MLLSALVGPLVLLQALEAPTLFCAGLEHSSVLSFRCPHHRHATHTGDREAGHQRREATAFPPVGHHASPGTRTDGDSAGRGSGVPIDCTCPSSGNPLPDGLTIALLGGLGVPSASSIGPATATRRVRKRRAPQPTHERLLPAAIDKPPRIGS